MPATVETIEQLEISKLGLEHYFRTYDTHLGPLQDQPIRLLELGVARGDSLRHWEARLPRAQITGLDVTPCPANFASGRVQTYVGEQQDTALLDRIAAERAPQGFDVIIDDASHVGQLTRVCFWHLFRHHLKPGGFYFIEDWGTGYWPQYPDGRRFRQPAVGFAGHERLLNRLHAAPLVRRITPLRRLVGWARWNLVTSRHRSHDYGMVGFVKELIDECGIEDATHPTFGAGPQRRSQIDWMQVSLGHVVIRKAGPQAPAD